MRALEGATNGLGEPITAESRADIEAYLAAPTEARWDKIQGLNIDGFTTVWQAWCAVDPKAPRTGRRYTATGELIAGWPEVPDPFTLRRALRAALKRR